MYRYRDTDPRARMMGFMVAIVVVMNVLMAFSGGSGVSWQAHLGGLIAGAVYGYAVISRTPTPRGPRPISRSAWYYSNSLSNGISSEKTTDSEPGFLRPEPAFDR